MNTKELEEFTGKFFDEMRGILGVKGVSYSGATDGRGDRLGNFKRSGLAAGVSPAIAWLIFAQKHMDAIATYARTGLESEPIRSRFLDLANYALLGAALVEEKDAALGAEREEAP